MTTWKQGYEISHQPNDDTSARSTKLDDVVEVPPPLISLWISRGVESHPLYLS